MDLNTSLLSGLARARAWAARAMDGKLTLATIKVVECALLRKRIVAFSAGGTGPTGYEYLFVILLMARANNIQSFRCQCKARPRKRPRSISRTFYAIIRWLRRPGP